MMNVLEAFVSAKKKDYTGDYHLVEVDEALLQNLVSSVPGDFLEIGTYDGIMATIIAKKNPHKKVHCVDYFKDGHNTLSGHQAIFEENVKNHQASNVKLFVGDSTQVVPQLNYQYGIAFVDGEHSYETCSADLENCWQKLLPSGILAFHDYGSAGHDQVTRAVDDFLRRKSLKLTLRGHSIGCITKPQFSKFLSISLRCSVLKNKCIGKLKRIIGRICN